jgi:hypothetical protein
LIGIEYYSYLHTLSKGIENSLSFLLSFFQKPRET